MSTRVTTKITLPSSSIGSDYHLVVHRFGPQKSGMKVYIQSTLHADELPGLLVARHLINLFEIADKKGLIAHQIEVIPFANPIGLSQNLLGTHMGRFNLASGANYNRNFENVTSALIKKVEGKLHPTDEQANVRLIREAFKEELDSRFGKDQDPHSMEQHLKYQLMREACDADIILDLHCDSDAIIHMYTHDRLWPQLSDLAALLGTECNIIDPDSGVNCFDEACSSVWAALADKYPDYPIPMACQATTIELRGQYEVFESTATKDAVGIYQFLIGRGFILPDTSAADQNGSAVLPKFPSPFPELKREATPLTGVDMIKAPAKGVLSWFVKAGDTVAEDQILGEIVPIEDAFAPTIPIKTRTAGVVFGLQAHKLAIPGLIVIKVAGDKPLPWREAGKLLTSR